MLDLVFNVESITKRLCLSPQVVLKPAQIPDIEDCKSNYL